MKIKLILFGFTVLALFWLAGCVEHPFENVDNTEKSVSEEFSYEIPVDAMYRLRLSAINSPIDIVGISNARSVRIWGERRVASDSYRDAESHLDDLTVNITQNRDELLVRTLQPENTHGRQYSIEYHIRVPLNWDLVVDDVNGDIDVDACRGDVEINVVNGTVQIRDLIGNLEANTTNGSLDVTMELIAAGWCRMNSVNGEIDLLVPHNTSAQFNAALVSGKISLSNITLTNQVNTRTSLRGVLADGNGQISLQTVNGSIYMRGM